MGQLTSENWLMTTLCQMKVNAFHVRVLGRVIGFERDCGGADWLFQQWALRVDWLLATPSNILAWLFVPCLWLLDACPGFLRGLCVAFVWFLKRCAFESDCWRGGASPVQFRTRLRTRSGRSSEISRAAAWCALNFCWLRANCNLSLHNVLIKLF